MMMHSHLSKKLNHHQTIIHFLITTNIGRDQTATPMHSGLSKTKLNWEYERSARVLNKKILLPIQSARNANNITRITIEPETIQTAKKVIDKINSYIRFTVLKKEII